MRTSRFLIVFLLMLGLTGISVLIGSRQAYNGDLTRIGALPDNLFRASKADVAIPASSQINSPIETADVIVVGDSFSVALQWQSVLVEKGVKVHTTHWATLEHLNVSPQTWLRNNKAKPDATLVLQIVERSIESQTRFLDGVVTSQTTFRHPQAGRTKPQMPGANNENAAPAAERESTAPDTHAQASGNTAQGNPQKALQAPHATQNINNRMSTGARLIFNEFRLAKNADFVSQYPGAPGGTRVSQFPDGCRYFTNVQCGKLLTLAADEKSKRYDAEYRDKLMELGARMAAKDLRKIVWLIVPNKTSIYKLPPDNAQALGFHNPEMGPNLFAEFVLNREKPKDLYLPDDTHLSNEGSRLMGKIASAFLPGSTK